MPFIDPVIVKSSIFSACNEWSLTKCRQVRSSSLSFRHSAIGSHGSCAGKGLFNRAERTTMADKVTVEEINGTLALHRMKHREKLLRIIKGGQHRVFSSLLLVAFAIVVIWFHAFETSTSTILILVLLSLFILAQALDRRFDALVELLDLDSQHSSYSTLKQNIQSESQPRGTGDERQDRQ